MFTIDFNKIDYNKFTNVLTKHVILNKYFDNSLLTDIKNKNINKRLLSLIDKKYFDKTIEHFNILERYVDAWSNLLREWFYISVNKFKETQLYFARVKYHKNYLKIGITYDIKQRSEFKNNKYFNYKIIRTYPNRYVATYVEYKLRTLFCINNEIINIQDLDNVINYMNNIKQNKSELRILGWKFCK